LASDYIDDFMDFVAVSHTLRVTQGNPLADRKLTTWSTYFSKVHRTYYYYYYYFIIIIIITNQCLRRSVAPFPFFNE